MSFCLEFEPLWQKNSKHGFVHPLFLLVKIEKLKENTETRK